MKKTQSVRLDNKIIESITKLWGNNFNKWIEFLYEYYNTNITQVWYDEFKDAFQKFAEVAKKFKPIQLS